MPLLFDSRPKLPTRPGVTQGARGRVPPEQLRPPPPPPGVDLLAVVDPTTPASGAAREKASRRRAEVDEQLQGGDLQQARAQREAERALRTGGGIQNSTALTLQRRSAEDERLADIRSDRERELQRLPRFAHSEAKRGEAKLLRQFVGSSLFPKDVLGSQAKDEKRAARGKVVQTVGFELPKAVRNALRENPLTAFAGQTLSSSSTEPAVDSRKSVDSLRRVTGDQAGREIGRLATNFASSIGSAGVLPLVRGAVGVGTSLGERASGQEIARDRVLPELARNIAAGRAAGSQGEAAGKAVSTFTKPVFDAVPLVGDFLEDVSEGLLGKGAKALGKVAESGTEFVARELGLAKGAQAGAERVPEDKNEVRRQARLPLPTPDITPGELKLRRRIADLNLLHLPRVDPSFAQRLTLELAKKPLSPEQLAHLKGRFSDELSFQSAIERPEQARVRLRQLLGADRFSLTQDDPVLQEITRFAGRSGTSLHEPEAPAPPEQQRTTRRTRAELEAGNPIQAGTLTPTQLRALTRLGGSSQQGARARLLEDVRSQRDTRVAPRNVLQDLVEISTPGLIETKGQKALRDFPEPSGDGSTP